MSRFNRIPIDYMNLWRLLVKQAFGSRELEAAVNRENVKRPADRQARASIIVPVGNNL